MPRPGDVAWGKLLALIVILAFAAVGLTTFMFAVMPDDLAFFTTITIAGLVLVGVVASMRAEAGRQSRGSREAFTGERTQETEPSRSTEGRQ